MMPAYKHLAIASASISAVALAGYMVYMLKKNLDDDVDDGSNDTEELEMADLNIKAEDSVASAGQTVVYVTVPQHIVGSIIGKDGDNIKKLRSEFGVRFNFNRNEVSPEEEKNVVNKKRPAERVLEIRGQRDKVRLAEFKINALIAETPKYVESEVFVPYEMCGRIIGKGGQNIREMCSVSGAKIVLERDDVIVGRSQRRIQLSGTTVQIEYAKLLIKEKIEQAAADTYKYGKKADGFQNKSFYNLRHVSPPRSGEYFQIFVSSANTPNDFWVQLVTSESNKLDILTDQLTEVYGKLAPEEERLESGNKGELCVAPYEGGMYRAAMRKINWDRTAELFYVDFGDIATVPLDDIKILRSEFKEMYGQAIHFKLPINPIEEPWSDESCMEFKEMVYCAQWRPIMAKILNVEAGPNGEIYTVQLVDTSKDEDLDVAAELTSKGHAVYSDTSTIQ